MKTSGFTLKSLLLAAACLPFTVGCGGGGSPSTPPTADSTPSAPTQSSLAATIVQDGASTEPAQTVAIFLDSLRKGDEQAANSVLTSLARQELAKSTYVMQPLGTPAGKYQIGRVSFPYADNPTHALVECTWTEPPVDNQPSEAMDIVCEVRQETEGWRISGIGVSIPGTEQTLVLDFENAAKLQATIEAATGETTPQPATQVATGQMTATEIGLPAFPNGAAETQPASTQGYTEVALPQFNGAPINR